MRLPLITAFFALFSVACAQGQDDITIAGDAGPKKDTGTKPGDTSVEETDPVSDSIAPTDMGACTPPAGSPCALFPQCGCCATQNCVVTTAATGKTACIAAGTDGVHEPCTSNTECQKGMQCIAGVCVPFCKVDSDCTIAGSPRCKGVQYLPSGSTTPTDVPGLKICLAQCDVLNPSTVCGPNTSCFFPYLSDDTTECTAAGTSTVKGGCATNNFACAPGYICVNDGDCFKWCRIGFATDCPSGRVCTGFMTPITKSGTEYGVCAY
jgi:hypothetical protein